MTILDTIAKTIGYIFMAVGGIYLSTILIANMIYALGDKRKLYRWARKGRKEELGR